MTERLLPSWIDTQADARNVLFALRRGLAQDRGEIERAQKRIADRLGQINQLKAKALKEGWDL